MEIDHDQRNRGESWESIKHPFRAMVVGKSQSGKTTFAVRLVMHMRNKVERVIIVSPTYSLQPTWQPVKKYVDDTLIFESGERYTNTYDDIRKIITKDRSKVKTLLVMDDLSSEKSLNPGSKGSLSWLVYNAVWLNLSIIVIAHRLSSVTLAIRENLEHLFVFTLINVNEIKKLAQEFNITGDQELMKELYTLAVARPVINGDSHSFLYVRLSSPPAFFRTMDHKLLVNV